MDISADLDGRLELKEDGLRDENLMENERTGWSARVFRRMFFSLPLSSFGFRVVVERRKMWGLTLSSLCAQPSDLELLQADGLSGSVSTN